MDVFRFRFSGDFPQKGKTKKTYAKLSILRIQSLYSKFSTNLRDAASGSDNTYST